MKTKRKLFARVERDSAGVGDLEVMGLQHFILPFSLLGVGLVLATVVWTIELSIKHMGTSSRAAVDGDAADAEIVEADIDVDRVAIMDVDDLEDDV